ncbi:hypothetical protein GGS21DRAFT_487683 [Xylaria nigripes]|nr:hypothetical protein GGS21DRAFT_487683 [Xylaria nigripes]
MAVDQPQEAAAKDRDDEDTKKWIDSAPYIPTTISYDWHRFCKALIECHRDALGVFRPPVVSEPGHAGYGPGGRKRDGHVTVQIIPEHLVPQKDPERGSWDYVNYIPAWTDPEYVEDYIMSRDGRVISNTVRDAVFNLRPALRLDDVIRNPTDYAQRFGIAADRLDGRSRMSPSWSKTRNPFDDFENQVNLLSDEERKVAENMSREIYRQSNRVAVPGQEILPEVMQTLLSQHGLLTNEELVEEVRAAAATGMSLDQMVDILEKRNPQIRKAHQVFLDNALQDQDYQRILLAGSTTDELIQDNVHTMSNDVQIELDNPIHPFFQRHHWEDCRWKGSQPLTPKHIYSINGTREEWDARNNDALWKALEPALRLASMILDNNPPHLEAIYDMTTRQPIPLNEDGRKFPDTPTLTKYVRKESIDLDETYPALRQLKQVYNYDWKANVQTILHDTLTLEIDSGFEVQNPTPDDNKERKFYDPFGVSIYGCTSTRVTEKGGIPTPTINITLSAEMIWPLLVPQYSRSEKIICSFVVASTLLHEFAHAVSSAQAILIEGRFREPPIKRNPMLLQGQDPEITKLLHSLNGQLFSNELCLEPFFEDAPADELGADFENSLWGCLSYTIPGMMPRVGLPRYYRLFGIAICVQSYPNRPGPHRINRMIWPHIYQRPLPIEYVAKLFRKSFWEKDFKAYGFSALKIMAGDRIQKNHLVYHGIDDGTNQSVYGTELARFLRAVPNILRRSRQHILGTYLGELLAETAAQERDQAWWLSETESWEHGLFHPLRDSIEQLDERLVWAKDLSFLQQAEDQMACYEEYLDMDTTRKGILSFDEWKVEAKEQWHLAFRYGGLLMQSFLKVHNHMQNDLGNMQRLVFCCLSLNIGDAPIWPPNSTTDNPTAIGRAHARLCEFYKNAMRFAGLLGEIVQMPQLKNERDKWEEWRRRFESNGRQYQELVLAIEGAQNADPSDITWKAGFKRLPTSDWKLSSDRYKKMAIREYQRANPAVRDTVDDFLYNLPSFDSSSPLWIQAESEQIEDLLTALPRISNIPAERQPLFEFKIRQAQSTSQVPQIRVPPAARPGQARDSRQHGGVTFGVAGGSQMMSASSLGDSPPRRFTGQKLRDNNRERPTSSAQQSLGYSTYATNLLSSPDPNLSSPAATELFTSGVALPITVNSGTKKQLVPGSKQQLISPFPNPYANRTVLTSEFKAFQEQKKLKEHSTSTIGKVTGIYKSARLWREIKDDSDDDEDMPPPKKQRRC